MFAPIIPTGSSKPIAPYAHGTQADGVVYVSGTLAIDPNGASVPGDVTVQTHYVIKQIAGVLKAAGASLSDIAYNIIILKRREDYAAFNKVYAEYFGANPPARYCIIAELVRDGRITRQEADVHPQRNIVTRVLGPYESIDVDVWPVDAVRGDRIVLCSDGLSGEVGEDQISAVLRRLEDPTEAATELVRLANEAGGRDNITVVVVDVE